MKNRISGKIVALFLVLFGFTVRCSTEGDNNQQVEELAFISIVSGDHQISQDNTLLANPIVVELKDAGQNPLNDQTLYFSVVEGEGMVPSGSTQTTDISGRVSIQWRIGSGYNGIEVTLSSDSHTASPTYICAEGDNPVGIHQTRTIASFHNVEGVLYSMTFYGNYSHEVFSQSYLNSSLPDSDSSESDRFNCSLFTVFGDKNNYLMGRSFDNPAGWVCLTMITKLNPSDGYASIAPVRMRDIGFGPNTDFDSMTFSARLRLLDAVYFPPDGINEPGLIMGLANVTPMPYYRDPDNETIGCQPWVRKVLDQCSTVDEAVALTMRYNIAGGGQDVLDVHAIVADASGRSIILDPAEGEMKIIPHIGNFQVMTNSPIYQVPLDTLFQQCWRFQTIYERLELENGILSSDEALDLLQEVGNQWTEWSAVYLLNPRGFRIAIDFNFDPIYDFHLFPLW